MWNSDRVWAEVESQIAKEQGLSREQIIKGKLYGLSESEVREISDDFHRWCALKLAKPKPLTDLDFNEWQATKVR